VKRFKITLMAGLLALAGTGANASTIYTLQSIYYENQFSGLVDLAVDAAVFTSTIGTATATDDGLGNITLTGVAWLLNDFGQSYTNGFDATTVVGTGVTLYKSNNTCTEYVGTFCTANRSGFGGNTWYTGLAQDGTTPLIHALTNVTISGGTLSVFHRMRLQDANPSPPESAFQYYQLNFGNPQSVEVVPVPAAVWLFGSALGLLGVARRRLGVRSEA
jgi:hypothetical protein